ncbi:hypothetical protein DV738_g4731, partial [Chaetothyriales sp. CBS 135597]
MAGKFDFSLRESDSFSYSVNTQNDELQVFSLDLIVRGYKPRADSAASESENARHLLETTLLAEQSGDLSVTAVKLLLPSTDGYVSRSDMVAFRLRGLDVDIHSFLTPRQFVKAVRSDGLTLDAATNDAIGAIVSKDSFRSSEDALIRLKQLEHELKRRLALPWILPDPIPPKRVALVGGLEEPESLASVKAMGIGLLILDQPGNMFEDNEGPFAHLREEFIPFNMSPDKHAPQRIVDALRDKKIDGIHTRYDIHHTNVAKANRILGLPTSDPEAYAIATNKFAARSLEPDKNGAFRVKDVEELKTRLSTLQLEYPLIVKPTTGRNSWGVLRCDNEEELIEAAGVAHGRLIGVTEDGEEIHSEVMIEPYVDGPEFDVDVVLWDGKLLFYEVSDNFPCAGDISSDPNNSTLQKGAHRDFQETLFVYPSILVEDEQQVLVKSLHETVLRLGLRSGVFHIEARVKNSKMEYSVRDGWLDLHLKENLTGQESPSCFLIETNPRPPGYLSLLRAGWQYGLDYWALHVLRCINDEKRFLAFAVPRPRDPEHVCALHFILPENGGILKSPDPGPELATRNPELMKSIPLYYNEFKIGEYVPPSVSTNFLFMTRMAVESRNGRDGLLQIIRNIEQEWTFVIEEE